MESTFMMGGMLAFCLIAICCIVFSKQLKFLFRIVINSVFGIVGIFLFNYVTGMAGITVGINLLTVFITGLLGLPGFACLYIVQLLL